MAKKPTKRSDVKVQKIEPADRFKGVKYVCVRCEKKFSAHRASKYCSDSCRVKGPYLVAGTGGRAKYHGPQQLANEIQEYFSINDENQITPAGLLLFLGIDKKLWAIYEQRPQLTKVCAWAQLKMEHLGTQRLYKNGRVADIFFMKNMGWSDKKEIDKVEHIIIGNTINDEQAEHILERYSKRRRLSKGKAGGTSTNSKGS